MGIIKDIMDTVKDISDLRRSGGKLINQKGRSSLSRASTQGTLQFPTIISKSLDIDTAQMIAKGLERQYASFIQIVLSMSPMLDLAKDKDAMGYLRKFHQNSGTTTSFSEIQNFAGGVLDGDTKLFEGYTDEQKEMFMFAMICEGATNHVTVDNREQLAGIFENFREDALNDKFTPRTPKYSFTDKNLMSYHNRNILMENNADENLELAKKRFKFEKDKEVHRRSSEDQRMGFEKDKESYRRNSEKQRMSFDQFKEMNRRNDQLFASASVTLKDNEVKKSNELVPTTMTVRTILTNEDGVQGNMDFVIGVKATMHPVTSDEVVNNMLSAVQGNDRVFNFIRWTTGEINFFKDFLLNINEIKNDVKSRSAGSSPWWIALKRRKSLAKVKRSFNMPNQLLPNSTIVVSKEEVEYIKAEYGHDLMKHSTVDKIMKQYYLLGFVVVDNSTAIVHFMFDGQSDWQSVTFNGLERENSKGLDIKEVMKLVNRSNM